MNANSAETGRTDALRNAAAASGLLLRKNGPTGYVLIDPITRENTLVPDLEAVANLLALDPKARHLSHAEALAIRSGLSRMMERNRVTDRAARIASATEAERVREMSEVLVVHADDTCELVGNADDVFMQHADHDRKYVILGPSGNEDYELRTGDTLLIAGTQVDPDALRPWEPEATL